MLEKIIGDEKNLHAYFWLLFFYSRKYLLLSYCCLSREFRTALMDRKQNVYM